MRGRIDAEGCEVGQRDSGVFVCRLFVPDSTVRATGSSRRVRGWRVGGARVMSWSSPGDTRRCPCDGRGRDRVLRVLGGDRSGYARGRWWGSGLVVMTLSCVRTWDGVWVITLGMMGVG